MRISWVPGHAGGDGADARGNGWADTLAKWGAALHGLLEETIKEAKRIRKDYIQIVRWLGRSAAAGGAGNPTPNRQPKAEWPQRTAEEKKALAEERGGITGPGTGRWPTKPAENRHKWRRTHEHSWTCTDCGLCHEGHGVRESGDRASLTKKGSYPMG